MNVHEAAVRHGLKIPGNIFLPMTTRALSLPIARISPVCVRNTNPPAAVNAVVLEHLDRLSRNADWHQGYLLDEMRQYGLQAVFWKEFTSRIERAVMGAIAQDGMEQAKQRMAEGNLHKAQWTGDRPTCWRWIQVGGLHGREGETAKKDTHYAIREGDLGGRRSTGKCFAGCWKATACAA